MASSPFNVSLSSMALERHDLRDVAALIEDSAPELFALLFGTATVSALEKLVQRSHNRFSHRYIQVAELSGRVVGVAVAVPTQSLADQADYREVFDRWQLLRLQLAHRLILDRVLQHEYPDGGLYIGNLAVSSEYRGRGIGTQLLQRCITNAIADASPVFISVDIHNPRAQKLYESLGFQVTANKTMSLLGKTFGSRVLMLR